MSSNVVVNSISTADSFIKCNFQVIPNVDSLPDYFLATNKTLESGLPELARVGIVITARQLSRECLVAIAKGFKPWEWQFLSGINRKISWGFPVADDDHDDLISVATGLLIAAIEHGALVWAVEHAASDTD